MAKLQSLVPKRPESPVRIPPNIATHPAPSTEDLTKNYVCRFEEVLCIIHLLLSKSWIIHEKLS